MSRSGKDWYGLSRHVTDCQTAMSCYGVSQTLMESHYLSRTIMGCYGPPRTVMDCSKLSWNVTQSDVLSRIVTDFGKFGHYFGRQLEFGSLPPIFKITTINICIVYIIAKSLMNHMTGFDKI